MRQLIGMRDLNKRPIHCYDIVLYHGDRYKILWSSATSQYHAVLLTDPQQTLPFSELNQTEVVQSQALPSPGYI